jgi:uncharacterized protein (TIGR03435 family)
MNRGDRNVTYSFRRFGFTLSALLALFALTACDKKDDATAPAGPKAPGTELSTVPGTSVKRVAEDSKAESSQSWTFNGLDAKSVELDDLIIRTLPPDGWMGDAKLPGGKYDVKIDLSGKTPEEMRPTLFKAIESALGLKLSLARKDMDGYVIRAAEDTPPLAKMKADPAASFAIAKGGAGWRFTAVSMDTFADWASRELGKPVGNGTDLPGKFTFELPAATIDPAALTSAAKSLGLAVAPQRLEQQVLVAEPADAAK